MYIKKWYSTKYKFIYFNEELSKLSEILQTNDEPIIVLREDNTLFNLVTPEDFKFIISHNENKKIFEIFDPVEYFLYDDDMVEDALLLMIDNRVKVLPVVDSEMYPLGIFGFFEVIKAFKGVSAMDEPGTKVVLQLDDKPGSLKKIIDILSVENINILSLLKHIHLVY